MPVRLTLKGANVVKIVHTATKLEAWYRLKPRDATLTFLRELVGVGAHLTAHFGISTSIKTTSIKPSGTVSLLAGATPGTQRVGQTHDFSNGPITSVNPRRSSNESSLCPFGRPNVGSVCFAAPVERCRTMSFYLERTHARQRTRCFVRASPRRCLVVPSVFFIQACTIPSRGSTCGA